MRVVFLVTQFPEASGDTFITRKIRFLQDHGHEVVVFRAVPHPPLKTPCRVGDVILEDLPASRGTLGDTLLAVLQVLKGRVSPRAAWKVARSTLRRQSPHYTRSTQLSRYLALAAHQPDLIHVHFALNIMPILGAREVLGVPVVCSLLGRDVIGHEQRRTNPDHLDTLSQECDSLVASSNFLVQAYRERTGSEQPVEVLFPELPYEDYSFQRQYDHPAPLRITTVARLHWKKAQLYALHAMRLLKDQGFDFVYDMIGEGDQLSSLRQAIRDLGLEDRVVLHGAKPPEAIPEFLRRSDIFLLCSVRESFGLAVAEAQAAGLPVVASRVDGIPEALSDGETGFLVPPRDPAAIAGALARLMSDAALRERMGRAAHEFARKFDVNETGGKLLNVYEQARRPTREISSPQPVRMHAQPAGVGRAEGGR